MWILRRSIAQAARMTCVRYLQQSSRVQNVYTATGTEETRGQAKDTTNSDGRLYDTHIQTTCFQRGLLTVGSSLMAFADPTRDDMVATLGEVTGSFALRQMEAKMRADAEGQRILAEKPRISSKSIDLDRVATFDGATLGYAYANWIKSQGVTPDSRKDVKFVDDATLAYVMQRYREVHDFTHVVLNQPITLLGETFVKAFEAVQTGLPMCVLASIFGPLKISSDERMTLITRGIPWIMANAPRAKPFYTVYFEKYLDIPLEKFRRDYLHIEAPPFGFSFTK